MKITINGKEIVLENIDRKGDTINFTLQGEDYSFCSKQNGHKVVLSSSDRNYSLHCHAGHAVFRGRDFFIEEVSSTAKRTAAIEGEAVSPMPGKVLQLKVAVGDEVVKGDPLVVVEAMKMEHTLRAGRAGIVAALHCGEGELVEGGVNLVELENAAE